MVLRLIAIAAMLATLVELGFLEEMEFEAGDNRYDTRPSPHINLVCTVCGAETHMHRTGRIPPCPKCHATSFKRLSGQSET